MCAIDHNPDLATRWMCAVDHNPDAPRRRTPRETGVVIVTLTGRYRVERELGAGGYSNGLTDGTIPS